MNNLEAKSYFTCGMLVEFMLEFLLCVCESVINFKIS